MNARDLAHRVRDPAPLPVGDLTLATIEEALAGYIAELSPLYMVDPRCTDREKRSPVAASIDAALCNIGAKLAPTLADVKVDAWRDAVMVSLSKWPATVALAAARAGRHEPFRFGLNDVDARLHELAAEIDAKHQAALARLRRMAAEVERAANPPQPQIEQQEERWTQERVDECNATFKRARLRMRYRLLPDGGCENFMEPEDPEGVAAYESVGYEPSPEGNPTPGGSGS